MLPDKMRPITTVKATMAVASLSLRSPSTSIFGRAGPLNILVVAWSLLGMISAADCLYRRGNHQTGKDDANEANKEGDTSSEGSLHDNIAVADS
jgi:hypothetical protein